MSLKVNINGTFYDKEDAKISVYDHGLLYGDGVFEGLRSYGGKVFQLEKHLDQAIGLGPHDLPGDTRHKVPFGRRSERNTSSQ